MRLSGIRQLAWLVALVSLAGCGGTESPLDTTPAGEVTLATMKTADWDAVLAEHRGKIVVVDTWATWCAPCVAGFPKLVALHREYGDKGVEFISVSVDDAGAHDAALNFLHHQQATFANYRLDDDAWWDRWDIKSIPVVMVFDRDGQLARKFDMDDPDNQFTYNDVEKLVGELVGR